jgi:hypothetical protein
VHCHSALSYDCQVPLVDLCRTLQREGFHFVALTEHAQGVTAENYANFVAQCQQASTGAFVAVPGLEVRCGNGVEITGIGVTQLFDPKSPWEAVATIRNLGGFAIWVHPWKHGPWNGPLLDCDAVEVLNGKVDGTLAPNLRLLRWVRKQRQKAAHPYVIFGLDLHSLEHSRDVWIECQVPALTQQAIMESFREGQFVSRIASGAVSSSGQIAFLEHLQMLVLRSAYLAWRATLRAVPEAIRGFLIDWSRPLVRVLKRHKTIRQIGEA